MKKINLLTLLLLGILSAKCVNSQNIDHFYGGLGAGVGQSKIDDDRISSTLLNNGATSSTVLDTSKDVSYKIFGGYQFNPYLGLEVGYSNLGQFGFKANTVPPGELNGSIKLDAVDIDLIGYLPLVENLSLLGKIGLIDARARDTFTRSGSVYLGNNNPQTTAINYNAGIGFLFKMSEIISLRGEIERFRINDAVGNKGDINVASLSFVFPFGSTSIKEPTVVEHTVYEIAPVVVVATVEPLPATIIIEQERPIVVPVAEHLHVSFSSDVLFAFDRSTVSPEGKSELDSFLSQLDGLEYDQLTIVGHTDRIGSKAYNNTLSLDRADSVKSYLISRDFIDEHKISIAGMGSSEPVTGEGACKGLHSSVEAIACLSPDRRVEVDVAGVKIKNN